MPRLGPKDRTGDRYGMLVAVRPTQYVEGSGYLWIFQCDCGNTIERFPPRNHVASTHARISCGCTVKPRAKGDHPAVLSDGVHDATGERYGKLVVVKFTGLQDKNNRLLWNCECDCGNTVVVNAGSLYSLKTPSCGCTPRGSHRNGTAHNWTGYGEMPGTHWSRINTNAANRGYLVSFSAEEAWGVFLRQGGKCALSGEPLIFNSVAKVTTASLDRIDSSQGYLLENVQWIHKDLNRMKNFYSDEVFLDWCNKIVTWSSKRETPKMQKYASEAAKAQWDVRKSTPAFIALNAEVEELREIAYRLMDEPNIGQGEIFVEVVANALELVEIFDNSIKELA